MMNKIAFVLFLFLVSCNESTLPRPKGQLRLEYPQPNYKLAKTNSPFYFEANDFSNIISRENGAIEVHYPKMKATIYLSYKKVNNDIENLLTDAQKLTYKLHIRKAEEIVEQPFINPDKKVYGMFYQVGGDAAANALFYATDSTKNFVTASVYFYAKPNYDSILPAAHYVTNDMRKIMESIKWK